MECLKWVGVPIAPADAEPEILTCVKLITSQAGGAGAVRQVADWLLEDKNAVVSGMNLPPTNRSIAFASWTKKLGQLQFPLIKNIQDYAFFYSFPSAYARILTTHN